MVDLSLGLNGFKEFDERIGLMEDCSATLFSL